MNIARFKRIVFGALCLSTLSACSFSNNGYYIKPDGSAGTLAGVAELSELPATTQSLSLGATFKSNGKISRRASEALYQSFSAGLKEKGKWEIDRVGHAGDDFTADIAATEPVALDEETPKPSSIAVKMQPRLLVLVENHPDRSAATTASYVLSGMTYGGKQVHKATDRYDVTIAYRDAVGVERIYRGHQDLIFSTGSKLFGTDPSPGPGYKRYDSSFAAFNGIVDNSVNGSRRGKVIVGEVNASNSERAQAVTQAVTVAASFKPAATPAKASANDATPRGKSGIGD